MSFCRTALIEYVPCKHCFISVPAAWISSVTDDEFPVFQVSYGNKTAYFSWSGSYSSSDCHWIGPDVVCISGIFANKLGLKQGETVTVQKMLQVPSCQRIHVEPLSADDWEVFNLHAMYIQNQLLSQIRIVWQNQVFPIWVDKSVYIFIKIDSLFPIMSYAQMEQLTEVVVTPKLRHHNHVESGHDITQAFLANYPIIENNSQLLRPTALSTSFGYSKQSSWESQLSSTSKSQTGSSSEVTTPETPSSHYQQLVSKKSNSYSFFSFIFCFVKTLFGWSLKTRRGSQELLDSEMVSAILKHQILPENFDMMLRVQSLNDTMEIDLIKYDSELLFDPKTCNLSSIISDSGLKGDYNMNLSKDTHSVVPGLQLTSPGGSEFQFQNFDIVYQPTTIYVRAESIFHKFRCRQLPSLSFIATLIKVPLPYERAEKIGKQEKGDVEDAIKSSKEEKKSTTWRQRLVNEFKKDSEKSKELKEDCVVRVIVVSDQMSDSDWSKLIPNSKLIRIQQQLLRKHVLIPDIFRKQENLPVTSNIRLKKIDDIGGMPETVTLIPMKIPEEVGHLSREVIVMCFWKWLMICSSINFPLLVTDGTLVRFPLDEEFFGEFKLKITPLGKKVSKYYYLYPEMRDSVRVEDGVSSSRGSNFQTPVDIDPVFVGIRHENLGGISHLVDKAIYFLIVCLSARPLPCSLCGSTTGLINGGLLVYGPKGCGKTAFSKALCRELSELPCLAYVSYVSCKPLRGKRVDSIRRILEKVVAEAVHRQPSIILLDDIDHMVCAPDGPGHEIGMDIVYNSKVAEVLHDLLSAEIKEQTKVAVIATSQSRNSVHSRLISTRGKHLFQEFIEITTPKLEDRVDILKHIILSKTKLSPSIINSVDLQKIANQTEGYLPLDLEMVVDRATHAACLKDQCHIVKKAAKKWTRGNKVLYELVLSDADFEVGLHGFMPGSLKGINLQTTGNLNWKDVGGLKEVKKVLTETLLWPIKYPQLFKNCPLRLRSGILLYGAPGTGKTLVAGAVAAECGMNFISIKGPELLSKYIGASEQAVRDTFHRAQSAKPCVLFFDEFDSIAPRRGHDSTGVTDRVVNQFLTQMDGVEGLDGVFVLAATSRPDLIDPALLRPGRLDKCLYLALPNEEERLEILLALIQCIHLADDVILSEIAEKSSDFTGADLKALLYNAQLEAIHSNCSKIEIPKLDRHEELNHYLPGTTAVVIEKQRPQVHYAPSLEEGCIHLGAEAEKKLLSELDTIKSNLQIKLSSSSMTQYKEHGHSISSTNITQNNLLKALSSMHPSVSEKEKLRYSMIYDSFVSSRGGNFLQPESPTGKKTTLA